MNDSISMITGTTKMSAWSNGLDKKLKLAKEKGAVAVAACGILKSACAEEVGGNLGCLLAGDVVSLDLYSEGLGFQVFNLAGGFLCHCLYLLSALPCVFSLSVCTYITLKGINSKSIRS